MTEIRASTVLPARPIGQDQTVEPDELVHAIDGIVNRHLHDRVRLLDHRSGRGGGLEVVERALGLPVDLQAIALFRRLALVDGQLTGRLPGHVVRPG